MSRKKDKYAKLNKKHHTSSHLKHSHSKPKRNFTIVTNNSMQGKIEGTGNGYAFFIPDDDSGDLFVSSSCLHGARHGDCVLVNKISQNKGNGEGEVVKIIKHNITSFTGVYVKGYVIPDISQIGDKIKVDRYCNILIENGTKVVASLIDGKIPLCNVVEILGKQGDRKAEMLAILRSFNIRQEFDKKVLKQSDKLPSSVQDYEMLNRVDYTNQTIITVDGEDSKDYDDAISVDKKNGYTLYVHIADVSHYVPYKSSMDKEAFNRGNSIYFGDMVIPMLPTSLSNGICSLNEGVNRLTLSVVIHFSDDGEILSSDIHESVIKSKARLTYNIVQSIFDGDKELINKYSDIVPMLQNAKELMNLLLEKREKRGAVDFDLPETKIIFDSEGEIEKIVPFERLLSHKMIEEFMIVTNEVVARKFAKAEIPFVFRVHDKPPQTKIENFQAFLSSKKLLFPSSPTPHDFNDLLNSVPCEEKPVVSTLALRAMSKANYKSENLGHYGLALEDYCHFTAPIRRYADLCIHRIIKYYLLDKECVDIFTSFVDEVSTQTSQTERTADEAERRVDDYLKARYMSNHINEKFDGVISGVNERGIFVQLDNSVEGMIKAENLPGGEYIYNEKLYSLSNGKYNYVIGQKLSICVEQIIGDKIRFLLNFDNEL